MGKQLKQYGILRPCVTIKKLLTNNYSICNLPFYNSKYIKCFQTFEDIDLEWVRRKENIEAVCFAHLACHGNGPA